MSKRASGAEKADAFPVGGSVLPPETIEAGRLLFARGVTFTQSVAALSQLPAPDRPEIAFAGRSNVGKSSLVNALAGRRVLARVSATPGRTQMLNYFAAGAALYLVDLPGYGHARAPKAQIAAWNRLTRNWLTGRVRLARVFLLTDARRGVREDDTTLLDALEAAAVPCQMLLTKCDKCGEGALSTAIASARAHCARRVSLLPSVLATSAREGAGIATLRGIIAQIAKDHAFPAER